MKFTRFGRHEPVTLTQRKASAFARKQEKERARYPLFSEHVAAEQWTLETEMAKRARNLDACEESMRSFYASCWRRSRAIYFAQPQPVKDAIMERWNTWLGPRTATYFAMTVDVLSGNQAIRLAKIQAEDAIRRAARPVDSVRATCPLF